MQLRFTCSFVNTIKTVLAIAILAAVTWRFWLDLNHEGLQNLNIHWEWLVLAAVCYLGGLLLSCWYWARVLLTFGANVQLFVALRAYYISQLGKYLPGKAWTPLMRGALIQGPEVKLGIAIIASFYEIVTMMASGAFLAAVFLAVLPSPVLLGVLNPALLALLLLIFCVMPIVPGVFNDVLSRLAKRFRSVESLKLARLRVGTLLEGLAATSIMWMCFGLSLWATVQSVVPQPQPLTAALWARYTATLALAYVCGFAAVVVPGGIGVREWVLDLLLAPELATIAGIPAQPLTAAIVLLLRITWTSSELGTAALLWWLPGTRRETL
jgi:glycosyltransferase 2 family protein